MHRFTGYRKNFFLIQLATIILLSVVGLPRNIEGMYWWMGIVFIDMVATHPIFYKEEG